MPAPHGRAGRRSLYEQGDVREEVSTPSFRPASLCDGLALPTLPAHRTPVSSLERCRTAFREPLQFIVMSVMGVMSLYP